MDLEFNTMGFIFVREIKFLISDDNFVVFSCYRIADYSPIGRLFSFNSSEEGGSMEVSVSVGCF
jgi:hypothetical protein